MARILLVDDIKNIRDMLKMHLEIFDHEIFEAEDGAIALQIIPKIQPNLILLDIDMPNLNGFGVLKKRHQDTNLKNIPVLMLTAKTETDYVVHALNMGANDYVKKPFIVEELIARVNTQLTLKSAQDQILEKDKRISEELEMAKKIQSRLLPSSRDLKAIEKHGFKAFVFNRATSEVGGDFVHLQNFEKIGFALTIADCMGHGVSAALMTMAASAFLSNINDTRIGPGKAFTELNKNLIGLIPMEQPIVSIQVRYTIDKGLSLSRAAFSLPIIYRKTDQNTETIKDGDIPLGYMRKEYQETKFFLEKGDRLLLFSDGMTEEKNAKGESFSLEKDRLSNELIKHGDHSLEICGSSIIQSWEKFLKGQKKKDDATFVILEKM